MTLKYGKTMFFIKNTKKYKKPATVCVAGAVPQIIYNT
jgi:hypothetical protein